MAGTAEVTDRTAEKVRQVEEQLNGVRDAVGESGVMVGELVLRLSKVLKDEVVGVKEEDAGDTPEVPVCELASIIRNVRRDIENQSDHVRSVLHRLEL